MNYTPLHQNILVLPKERETKTKSGLVMVADDSRQPNYGEVVAVSKEVTTIKVGDTIIYEYGSGRPISFDDVKYTLLDSGEHGSVLGLI